MFDDDFQEPHEGHICMNRLDRTEPNLTNLLVRSPACTCRSYTLPNLPLQALSLFLFHHESCWHARDAKPFSIKIQSSIATAPQPYILAARADRLRCESMASTNIDILRFVIKLQDVTEGFARRRDLYYNRVIHIARIYNSLWPPLVVVAPGYAVKHHR